MVTMVSHDIMHIPKMGCGWGVPRIKGRSSMGRGYDVDTTGALFRTLTTGYPRG